MAIVPIAKLETFASGLDHPEGVCVDAQGAVYCGGEAGQLYRIEGGKPIEVANTGGFVAGICADAAGFIYACDFNLGHVCKVDPRIGRTRVFCDRLGTEATRAPNWGAFDRNGRYYFSDSGTFGGGDGVIGVVEPDGAAKVWTREVPNFPNGLALSVDGNSLYVIGSNPSPRLYRVPIGSHGEAGPAQVILAFKDDEWPDGIAVAADDTLIISCYRPDRIYILDGQSRLRALAEDPLGVILAAPTNIAFTGSELNTLIATNLGRWHLTRIPSPVRGAALCYPDIGTHF